MAGAVLGFSRFELGSRYEKTSSDVADGSASYRSSFGLTDAVFEIRDPADAIEHAWRAALDSIESFPELALSRSILGLLDRVELVVSNADRPMMSTTPRPGGHVVSVDSGLVGFAHRLARFLGFFWELQDLGSERLRPRRKLIHPSRLERLFRPYLTELRWSGYLTSRVWVREPGDPSPVPQILAHGVMVFGILHELAHVVVSAGHSRVADSTAEFDSDALAAELFAQAMSRTLSPGITMLAIRHYFTVLQAAELALWMIRPTSHPWPVSRRQRALAVAQSVLGPDGSRTWSGVANAPLSSLLGLYSCAPATVGLKFDGLLSEVIGRYPEHFALDDRDARNSSVVNELEALDRLAYLSQSVQEEALAAWESTGTARPAAFIRGVLAGGEVEDFVDTRQGRIQAEGLRFADWWSLESLRGIQPTVAMGIAWSEVAGRLGWVPLGYSGARKWGCLPLVAKPPRALLDLAWLIEEGFDAQW